MDAKELADKIWNTMRLSEAGYRIKKAVSNVSNSHAIELYK